MKYKHPKEVEGWSSFGNSKQHHYSLKWLIKNIVYGLLDPEIKLCCLLHFSISLFLTGKPQACQRGIVLVEKYTMHQQIIHGAYVPCFLCLRRIENG